MSEYEKQSVSSNKDQVKYSNSPAGNQKSKAILVVILILVAIQACLFVWTIQIKNKAEKSVKEAKQLIPALKNISSEIDKVTAAYAETKPAKTVRVQKAQVSKPPVKKPVAAVKQTLGVFAYTFDVLNAQPTVGNNLLLIKKSANSSLETMSVHFDEASRLGAKGQGMKVEYQFNEGGPADDWMGLEFKIPPMNLTSASELSFWIKGDSKTGYVPNLSVNFSDGVKTASLPVSGIGTFWKRISFSMSKMPASIDYKNLSSVQIVVKDDSKSKKGSYSLDQFEIK